MKRKSTHEPQAEVMNASDVWNDAQHLADELGQNLSKNEQTKNVMINLTLHKKDVTELCKSLDVKTLYVFGSAVRDDFKESSDIDFLLSFHEGSNQFKRYFKLKFGLEKIFNRKCDVVMEDGTKNPLLAQYIHREKKIYYENLQMCESVNV